MKLIKKEGGLSDLEDWKKHHQITLEKCYKSNNHQGLWAKLPSSPANDSNLKFNYSKSLLKNSLLIEQGYICCYCQKRIGDIGIDHDIEHLVPQSENCRRTFDHKNMVISCKYIDPFIKRIYKESNSTKKKELDVRSKELRNLNASCNEKKRKESIAYFPTDQTIEEKFSYDLTGGMNGVDDVSENMVNLLNLNSEYLRGLRKATIEACIFKQIEYDDSKSALLSKDELKQQGNRFHSRNSENKFEPFSQVITSIISLLT